MRLGSVSVAPLTGCPSSLAVSLSGHTVNAFAVVLDFRNFQIPSVRTPQGRDFSNVSVGSARSDGEEYLTVLQSFIVKRFLEYNKC